MTRLFPTQLFRATLNLSAAANSTKLFNREIGEPTLRIYSLSTRLDDAAANRTLQFDVAKIADAAASLLPILCRENVGTFAGNDGQVVLWKDPGWVARVSPAGDICWDNGAPFIDIPPGYQIRATWTAGSVEVTEVMIQGVELTKSLVARSLLATNPDSLEQEEGGRSSMQNLEPNFALQGG